MLVFGMKWEKKEDSMKYVLNIRFTFPATVTYVLACTCPYRPRIGRRKAVDTPSLGI